MNKEMIHELDNILDGIINKGDREFTLGEYLEKCREYALHYIEKEIKNGYDLDSDILLTSWLNENYIIKLNGDFE